MSNLDGEWANRFIENLTLTGEYSGQKVKLRAWQKKVTKAIFQKKSPTANQYKRLFCFWPRGQAKALALDTPLPTPDGWTTMGEVEEGDILYDENGNQCRVILATEVMHDHECYRVMFSDGTEIVADAGHLWQTHTRKPENKVQLWTTEQIAKTCRVHKCKEVNHSIPVAGPLQNDEVDLPVDPYVLGAWLGDGNSRNAKLYCDVLENKHIPPQYLRGSYEQRLALLQGLMDTDGCVYESGQCAFDNKNEILANQVVELVRSLGLKPVLHKKRCKLYHKDCGDSYRVQFHAYSNIPIFCLSRKRERQIPRNPRRKNYPEWRYIVDVRPVPSVPVKCIQVDSPSHLYLAGEAMVPTHNTELAAFCIVAKLIGDPEHGQNIYSAAKNQKQASILFDRCAQIIRQDPYLKTLVEISDYKKEIHIKSKFSFYKALTADTSGGAIHGLNPSFLIVDEMHALGRNRDYFSALETAIGKRKNQQLLIISTAGEIGSICEEEFRYAQKVAKNPSYDPEYYPSLYYLEEDAPCLCGKHQEGWMCPQQWARVNPALNDFKEIGAMEMLCRQALENPGKAHEFKKFHLNMFQSDSEILLDWDTWKASGNVEVSEADFEDEPCWAGLDIGAVSDFTALVLITRTNSGIKVMPYFWLPEERIPELQHKTKKPILDWCNNGYIKTTLGNTTDFDVVRTDINEIASKFQVEKLGVDPHNATQLVTQLANDGIPIEMFRQGFISMNSPVKELQRLVSGRQCLHGNHPVLNWMAQNALGAYDANGNVKVDRRDRNNKVDGIVSLAMAIGVSGIAEKKESVYASRGAIVI